MPVTKPQAHALALLAAACRPNGSTPWDEPGIVAALGHVANLSLPEVAMATIRAAVNPAAKTPGVISVTTGEHWRERVTPSQHPHPPRTEDACRTCGRHLDACTCGEATTRPPRPAPADTQTATLAEMRAIIARAKGTA